MAPTPDTSPNTIHARNFIASLLGVGIPRSGQARFGPGLASHLFGVVMATPAVRLHRGVIQVRLGRHTGRVDHVTGATRQGHPSVAAPLLVTPGLVGALRAAHDGGATLD